MTCLAVLVERNSHGRIKRTLQIQCDICERHYESRWLHGRDEGLHFCSRQCAAIHNYQISNQHRQMTCMMKYGSKHHWSNSVIRNKTDWTLRNSRSHETMKSKGLYRASHIENDIFIKLQSEFGEENVIHWVNINGWSIDFHISTLDLYLQLDGRYWHGLDRPIEVIAEHRTKQDEQIHKKWITDLQQIEWFRQHDLKLLRVSDADVISSWSDVLMKIKAFEIKT